MILINFKKRLWGQNDITRRYEVSIFVKPGAKMIELLFGSI